MSLDNSYYDEAGSPSNLLDLYACRVCLATDIKLFDIHECDLAELFQSVTGELVPPDDGFPQHLCHYCFALLQKFAIFKEKCTRTHNIMQTASLLNQPITTEFIRNLDREAESLTLPLTINNTGFIDFEIIEQEATEEEIAEAEFRIKQEQAQEDEEMEQNVVEDPNEYVDTMYAEESKTEDIFDFGVGQPCDPENQIKITFPQEKDSLEESRALRGLRVTDHPNIEVITLTRAQQIKELIARKETTKYTSSLYKCEKCYRGFLNATTYRNHMVQHNPSSGPVECTICEMRFMTDANLKVHVANIHEKKFVCKLCFHVSSSSHRAIDHQRWHEGVTYNCKYCGQAFKRSTACMVHVRKYHEDQHQCIKCGVDCESESHLQQHECERNLEELTETWIQCVECDCEFNGVGAFNTHLGTSARHGGQRADLLHHCKQCGESFDGEVALQDHELIHVTTATVKQNQLQKPRKKGKYEVPKSKKPFVCPFCEKGFRFPQYLQIHVRTHTGEKPYVCNICTMAFQAKANLNRHFKVHTGEKPYMCELCGKHFTQSNSMKMHVKTVHFKMPDPYKDRRKFYKCKNRANTLELANVSS